MNLSLFSIFRTALLSLLCGAFLTPDASAQLSAEESQLAAYLTTSPGQRRPYMTLDPILSRVARQKAAKLHDGSEGQPMAFYHTGRGI